MRSDIVKVYKDVHTWVGIVSGFALFIAFYGGALTMFEAQIQKWASAPLGYEEITSVEKTQELLDKVHAAYPESRRSYQVVIEPTAEFPTRVNWQVAMPGADDHDAPVYWHADLDRDGNLRVMSAETSSPVGQLIDDLHRQVGIMLDHDIAMPIMGVIALLYGVALFSGVVVLLPTLVKDLFAFRQGKNLKRMWLDFHNLLGLFSLPFHIIMVITALAFAFHDQIYDAQSEAIYRGEHAYLKAERPDLKGGPGEKMLAPAEIINRVRQQAPEFKLKLLTYNVNPNAGPMLRAFGVDPAYGARSPLGGVAVVHAYSGDIIMTDYTPGMQTPLAATITSFFTLHFGSFGGSPIRWSYFFLALAGALLFYSGNLLYVETRRKKLKRHMQIEDVVQTRTTQVLGSLTIGVCLGCVAGISLTVASAKVIPLVGVDPHIWHLTLYYLVFFGAVAWSIFRGAALAAVELLGMCALTTAMIPLLSIASALIPGFGWNHPGDSVMVDVVALFGTCVFVALGLTTRARIVKAPTDSIWYVGSSNGIATNRLGFG